MRGGGREAADQAHGHRQGRIVPGAMSVTRGCSTATAARVSPAQRGHAWPCARGALQARAVIWARWSGVKVRRAPVRGRITHHGGDLPATAPLSERLRRATDLVGNVGIAPVGLVVRAQQQAGPRYCSEEGSVAGAEVVQARLLLWRELNRRLGSRAWHNDSPPEHAYMGGPVIGQALLMSNSRRIYCVQYLGASHPGHADGLLAP